MPWSMLWCVLAINPITLFVSQILLRKKVLDDDMSQYMCFQGRKSGAEACVRVSKTCFGWDEADCPTACLVAESLFCPIEGV
jgi:hypothetical protein